MKLKTKIAGSLALPLALAVAANSAQAFTVVDDADKKVTIGGYLSAITSWVDRDVAGTTNNDFSAGNSRLNFGYTDKETGTRFFYEQQFVGGATATGPGSVQSNGLRHAFFETGDGLIGGYTWSFGTNLVALAETIDTTGNGNTTYQVGAPRNLLLGQRFAIADGQKVGISLESQNNGIGGSTVEAAGPSTTDESVPAVTLNYEGSFGDTKVFAAFTNYGISDGSKDKRANRVTLGTNIGLDAANIKLGLTHNALPSSVRGTVGANVRHAQSTHASAALGLKLNEKVRANLAVEHSIYDKKNGLADDVDGTNIWLNAFYQADNGVEWGAELQYVTADTGVTFGSLNNLNGGALSDKDMVVRLQAKYAF